MTSRSLLPFMLLMVAACTDVLAPIDHDSRVPGPYLAPAAAANRSAPVRVTMFGAHNVGCGGATDVDNPRGAVQLRITRGGLRFTVNLNGAEPGSSYTVTAFTGDDCSNGLAFNDAILTQGNGNGSFAGFYPLASGTYAVLITAHTGFGVGDPANRDIGNVLVSVTVP